MVTYNNKVFGLADNISFKKSSGRGKRIKYILYTNKKAYPIKGISALLFEGIIHLNSINLMDISNKIKTGLISKIFLKKAIAKNFINFLDSNWIQENVNGNGTKLRLANYVHCTIVKDKYYIINFLYKTLDCISKETYELIINGEYIKLSNDELFYLYARKYLQHEHTGNEIYIFEKQNENKIVYLIFSYDCNLQCVYCFERNKSRQLQMSEEVLYNSIKYIDSLSVGNNVVLTFYGGEPLLEKNREYLNRVIENFKSNNNVYFRFITNGININEYIDMLSQIKNRIISFVITLDGNKKIHDSRRISKESQGSFDSIVNSINLLNKHEYPITIRINLDNENINCQEELVRYLNRAIKARNKVKIEYHRVEDKNNLDYDPISYIDCYRLFNRMKKISKFGITFNLPIINILNAIKNNRNGFPQIKKTYCTIDSNHVIDFDGRIYSCNEAMGIEGFQIGIAGQESQSEGCIHTIDKDCRSCRFYVACYGGCYLENYYYKKHKSHNKCYYNQFNDVVDYFLANELK